MIAEEEVNSRQKNQVKNLLVQLLGDRDVVAFRPRLARVLGAMPALFLSQACYWQAVAGPGAWWFKNRDAKRDENGVMLEPIAMKQSWEWELGMTRSEQESARRILGKFKLLEERLAGTPARLHYRVDLDELEKFLITNQQLAGIRQQDGRMSPTSRTRWTAKKVVIPPTNTDKTTKTTSEITTTTFGDDVGGGVILDGLIFEPCIETYRSQLLAIFRGNSAITSDIAQDLLDELAGSMQAGLRGERPKINSPVSWMREIVERLGQQRFDRVYCFRVQKQRAHRQQEAQSAAAGGNRGDPEIARRHLDKLMGRSDCVKNGDL